MNSSPAAGVIRDQSDQSYDAKSCGSITFAWSFHTRISDRATVETRIGCQERLRTSVGRCRTATIAMDWFGVTVISRADPSRNGNWRRARNLANLLSQLYCT